MGSNKLIVGHNDLLTWCKRNNREKLLEEWDVEKNKPLTVSTVTYGSGKKVWWRCANNHVWDACISSRVGNNLGCPYCSNRRILSGVNDLATLNPDLAKEWNSEKNGGISPTTIPLNYQKKVWWICDFGHEWEASPNSRAGGIGCPYCANKKVLVGYNDLTTTAPNLVSEWNFNKNGDMKPEMFTRGSTQRVWWLCRECGNEWQALISNRTRGAGCPKCGKKKQLVSFSANNLIKKGSLRDNHPELVEEWCFSRNTDITPDEVVSGTSVKVWWKCSVCGYEWKASILNRVKGRGCPSCKMGKQLVTRRKNQVAKHGSLADKYPSLAGEWDSDKNAPLTPQDINIGSTLKYWWKCSKGHKWEASVYDRVKGGGCPRCSRIGSSMPEQGIAFYLSQCCEINQRYRICGLEVDVFLPIYNIGIEYDGIYFHANKSEKDRKKTLTLLDNGIRLIRVIESTKNRIVDSCIYYKHDNMGHNYEWALSQLFVMLCEWTSNDSFARIVIDVEKDRIKIRERFDLVIKQNSLAERFPAIASEWNYQRNGILTPDMFLAGANHRVWWVCPLGHEWQTSIGNRTSQNTNCPYCSNDKLLVGFNDLATKHPELVEEWNYEKNDGLRPTDVINNTQRKVYWKCAKGHEWKASILSRCHGNGCPYCSNKKTLAGYNDICTLRPDLLSEWNYEKNNSITPDMVGPGTDKKVWWICEKGHEYESIIINRAKGHGCPYCAGIKPIPGETDLLTTSPDLVKEWDFEKNYPLLPSDFTRSSGIKVWWIDQFGHSWKASIAHRQLGTGCPYCAGQKVLAGFNDLATKEPDLADDWNYEKNIGLKNKNGEDISTPDKVCFSSGMKVWWRCSKGHEWAAVIASRASGAKCPICFGSSPKRIVCIETGIVYKSIKEAEIITGINHGGISCCCSGKQKTAGGYHWKYAD